ncbi:MAG: hypothetical protein ACM3XM_02840, partial [Mycobacterium leprae]
YRPSLGDKGHGSAGASSVGTAAVWSMRDGNMADVVRGVGAGVAPLLTPAMMLILGGLLLLITLLLGRGWPRWQRGMTWTCGIVPNARMEYSAAGQTKPILLMFKGLLQPVRAMEVDQSTHPLFPGRVRYQSELAAVFDQRLYRPVTRSVMNVATRLRRLQTGSLQTYLLYLLLAAVALIVAAR